LYGIDGRGRTPRWKEDFAQWLVSNHLGDFFTRILTILTLPFFTGVTSKVLPFMHHKNTQSLESVKAKSGLECQLHKRIPCFKSFVTHSTMCIH
jgi:hypothetical protein